MLLSEVAAQEQSKVARAHKESGWNIAVINGGFVLFIRFQRRNEGCGVDGMDDIGVGRGADAGGRAIGCAGRGGASGRFGGGVTRSAQTNLPGWRGLPETVVNGGNCGASAAANDVSPAHTAARAANHWCRHCGGLNPVFHGVGNCCVPIIIPFLQCQVQRRAIPHYGATAVQRRKMRFKVPSCEAF